MLAEANSAASEALGNIRTVRAFSTEELELEKYQSKTLAAMTKGVTDAFAYSFAVAINNWLDLGASVLILWWVQRTRRVGAFELLGVSHSQEFRVIRVTWFGEIHDLSCKDVCPCKESPCFEWFAVVLDAGS